MYACISRFCEEPKTQYLSWILPEVIVISDIIVSWIYLLEVLSYWKATSVCFLDVELSDDLLPFPETAIGESPGWVGGLLGGFSDLFV